jgi:hypothetical protein
LTREQRIAQAKEIIERREQVEKRAVMLVKKLRTAESTSSRVLTMEQLANHLMNVGFSGFPSSLVSDFCSIHCLHPSASMPDWSRFSCSFNAKHTTRPKRP